jgi:hypothetical protein
MSWVRVSILAAGLSLVGGTATDVYLNTTRGHAESSRMQQLRAPTRTLEHSNTRTRVRVACALEE